MGSLNELLVYTPSMAAVKNHDLGTLAVTSIRYSLGRASYMPAEIIRLILLHRNDIPSADLSLIRKEVTHALQEAETRGKNLGMAIDHAAWKAFLVELDLILK